MKIGWRGILGLLLSALLLGWALHDVSLGDVWQVVRTSNIALFVASALVATLAFPLRAWRWRYILHPVAPKLPFNQLWHATAIGMMANNVTLARAGELVRAWVLSRESPRVGFAAAFGSLAVDRLVDAMVILVLLVVAMASPAFPRGALLAGRPAAEYVRVIGAIAVLLLVALTLVALYPRVIVRIWNVVVGRVAPRFVERGRVLLESFLSGLAVLRAPRQFALVMVWAVVQWLVNGASFLIGFRALGIPAPFSAALFLQSIVALGVAIPSSPGFFGLFEAAALVALPVYGVSHTLALGWALGYHVLSFIPITVIGLFYLFRLGMHFRDFGAAPEGPEGATAS